jgi:nucleoside 2-deoxyribosyltransferase
VRKLQDWEETRRKHKIVTLVGSTAKEWESRYRQVERELCLAGYVVISVNVFKEEVSDIEKHRNTLESIHLQKIDMADAIVLIDKNAKGGHTAYEMNYCHRRKKPVVIFTTLEETCKQIETAT